MLRGYRGQFIALGLAFLLALVAGIFLFADARALQRTYEQQATEKVENYGNSARVRAETLCRLVPHAEIRKCVYEEYDIARRGRHDEHDLQAQLVTSVWTRAMGIAALIAMAVGILGVGLICTTFQETRRGVEKGAEANRIARAGHLRSMRNTRESAEQTAAALRIAERNADAAHEQVRVSRETAALQLRPWLVITGRVETAVTFENDLMRFVVALNIKNAGHSIARHIMTDVRSHPQVNDLPDDFPNEMYELAARYTRYGDILVPGEQDVFRFDIGIEAVPDENGYMWPVLAFSVTYNGDDGSLYETSPFYSLYDSTNAPYRRFKIGTDVTLEHVVLKRHPSKGRAT